MTVARDALLRVYRPGDEDQIQEAFAEVFARRRPIAEWRWKFLEPVRGSRILLAFDTDGRLLCQYAAIALDVAWHGRRIVAGQIVDVLSRGRGALGRRGGPFLRTVEQFLERFGERGDLAFIFGFPGVRHQRLGELAGLYHPTIGLERLVRPVEAGRPELDAERGEVREGFDATALRDLWSRAAHRYPATVVRDERWFAWRYAARPTANYEQVGVRRRGAMRAWGVLAVEGPVARWVDLVWDGADAADLAILAAALERRSLAARASGLELWLRGDDEARTALVALGFAPQEELERRLSVIVFDGALEHARVARELYLTLGDSDHV